MISSARLITVPVLVVFAFSVFAQTPARPKFEVATIKLNTDCGNGVRNDPVSPGRLGLVCVTVQVVGALESREGTGAALR